MKSLPEIKSIKTIVADDHPLYLRALTETIKKSKFISHVEQAKNGLEVLTLLKNDKYDLVFLDVAMPGMDGEETAFQIAQHYPNVKTIAISMFDSPEKIKQMYIAGCKSYILKVADESEILLAINNVLAGKNYFNQSVTEKLMQNKNETENLQFQVKFRLLPKEIKIIRLVCEGKPSKEIASELNLSIRTIEKYLEFIFDKTETTNRVELYNFSLKHHFIKT